MPEMDKFWRAWLSIGDYVIPSYAYPTTIRMEEGLFSANMGTCAEWGPLSRGKKPIKSNVNVSGFFKGVCGKNGGTLAPTSSGFSIERQDLKEAQFTGFTNDGDIKNPVTVITAGPLERQSRTILIEEGGTFRATPDLSSSSITCVVSYPFAVQASEEDADSVSLFIVGKKGEEILVNRYDSLLESVNQQRVKLRSVSLSRSIKVS